MNPLHKDPITAPPLAPRVAVPLFNARPTVFLHSIEKPVIQRKLNAWNPSHTYNNPKAFTRELARLEICKVSEGRAFPFLPSRSFLVVKASPNYPHKFNLITRTNELSQDSCYLEYFSLALHPINGAFPSCKGRLKPSGAFDHGRRTNVRQKRQSSTKPRANNDTRKGGAEGSKCAFPFAHISLPANLSDCPAVCTAAHLRDLRWGRSWYGRGVRSIVR